jgi:hypothetical protein
LKLKLMRAKQIVAVVVLLIVAFLIVFPPLLNSHVRVTLSSTTPVHADHVYVTIGEISAHRADISGLSGWQSISNMSTRIDLTLANTSETVGLGTLSLGQYETVRVKVTNATVIINGTSQKVQLESSEFTIPFSFLTKFGVDTVIILKVTPEVQETSGVVNLKLSFTAAPASPSS